MHDERVADRPLRLLHFDLKGLTNFGDSVLFDGVRQLFNGFGGGGLFEMLDTYSLHRLAGPTIIDQINESFDAVVVGGGGLFLRDTNVNDNSGWQWDIPMEMLARLRKPLIVFAVGYNRFPGQEDFDETFGPHVTQCIRQSCFFGLRNHGSIEAVRRYVPTELHDRIEHQPCPTTMAAELYPDLARAGAARRRDESDDPPRLGVELMVDRRMVEAGYDFDRLFDRHAEVLRTLQETDQWRLECVAHMANERHVADELIARGVTMERVDLAGSIETRERGMSYYSGLPMMYGARGHATMIPFGFGAIPLAALTHDKIRFFLDDIGHPEFGVDPDADDFEHRALAAITGAHTRRAELHADLARRRGELFDHTMANMATIYERLTGETVEPSLRPYTPFERRLAETTFALGIEVQEARAWAVKRGDTIAALQRRIAESPPPEAMPQRAADQ